MNPRHTYRIEVRGYRSTTCKRLRLHVPELLGGGITPEQAETVVDRASAAALFPHSGLALITSAKLIRETVQVSELPA